MKITREMWRQILLLSLLLIGVIGEENQTEPSVTNEDILREEEDLREKLTKDYDKWMMPVMNTKVSVNEISILDLKMKEADQAMAVGVRLSLNWDDPRLVWDLVEHPEIGFLGMDPSKIWTPDITVYSGDVSQLYRPQSSMPTVVYPGNGTILYRSRYYIDFTCVMDLTYWPHDVHQCYAKVGTWVHKGHRVDLTVKDPMQIDIPLGLTYNGRNYSAAEWNIVKTEVNTETTKHPCCREPSVAILLTVKILRNAPIYAWTVKLPAGCLSVLTVLLFLLPPSAGEKIILGALCLVSNLIFLAFTTFVIAKVPAHTPLIIQMLSQQVLLVTLSLIVSGVIVKLTRDPLSIGLPYYVKKALIVLSYPLCLKNDGYILSYRTQTYGFSAKSDELDLVDGPACDQERSRFTQQGSEWIFFAAVVDRFAFILYIAICVISLIRYNQVL